MYLTTPEHLMEIIGSPDSTGVRAVVLRALASASERVATYTENRFQEATYEDFYVTHRNTPTSLRLHTGFIQEGSLKLYYLETGLPITKESPGALLVKNTDYTVDPIKGTVELLSRLAFGTYHIKARYSAGFAVDAENVYQGVDETLRQAAAYYAAKVMAVSPANINKEKSKVLDKVVQGYANEAVSLMNRHLRPRNDMLFPAKTVQT